MQTVWFIKGKKKQLRASNMSSVYSDKTIVTNSAAITRLPGVQCRVEGEGFGRGVRVCMLRKIALPLIARFLRRNAGVVQPMGRVRLNMKKIIDGSIHAEFCAGKALECRNKSVHLYVCVYVCGVLLCVAYEFENVLHFLGVDRLALDGVVLQEKTTDRRRLVLLHAGCVHIF